jgi:hypothetical protein
MKHKVKVVILPTVKASQIFKSIERELRFLDTPKSPKWGTNQHLYVTVSQDVESIKKGDYILSESSIGALYIDGIINTVEMLAERQWRKVIATNDPELNKLISGGGKGNAGIWEMTPQLQQSFLKEYVANPDGEYEVEYESIFNVKFKYINNESPSKSILKLNQDNTVNITAVEPTIPIYIHKGIFNTDVQIKNGIVHVRPNKITPVKKKMYSREEIEHILIKFLKADKAWKDPKKWIKENL